MFNLNLSNLDKYLPIPTPFLPIPPELWCGRTTYLAYYFTLHHTSSNVPCMHYTSYGPGITVVAS